MKFHDIDSARSELWQRIMDETEQHVTAAWQDRKGSDTALDAYWGTFLAESPEKQEIMFKEIHKAMVVLAQDRATLLVREAFPDIPAPDRISA